MRCSAVWWDVLGQPAHTKFAEPCNYEIINVHCFNLPSLGVICYPARGKWYSSTLVCLLAFDTPHLFCVSCYFLHKDFHQSALLTVCATLPIPQHSSQVLCSPFWLFQPGTIFSSMRCRIYHLSRSESLWTSSPGLGMARAKSEDGLGWIPHRRVVSTRTTLEANLPCNWERFLLLLWKQNWRISGVENGVRISCPPKICSLSVRWETRVSARGQGQQRLTRSRDALSGGGRVWRWVPLRWEFLFLRAFLTSMSADTSVDLREQCPGSGVGHVMTSGEFAFPVSQSWTSKEPGCWLNAVLSVHTANTPWAHVWKYNPCSFFSSSAICKH